MLIYKFPWLYELVFKFPPALIWRKKSLSFLVKELQNLLPKSILDVGCGSGILTPILRKLYPHSQILGIDKSSHMIRFAKQRYGGLAVFRVIDFFDYQGKHDLIVGFYSFEFLPLIDGIRKIKTLLEPGGVCIIVTTGRAPFSILHKFFVSKFLRTNIRLYSPFDFYHFVRNDKFSLKLNPISEFEGSYIVSLRYKQKGPNQKAGPLQ